MYICMIACFHVSHYVAKYIHSMYIKINGFFWYIYNKYELTYHQKQLTARTCSKELCSMQLQIVLTALLGVTRFRIYKLDFYDINAQHIGISTFYLTGFMVNKTVFYYKQATSFDLRDFSIQIKSQYSQQQSVPDLHVFTLKFHSNFSLKKTVFFFSLFQVQKIKKKKFC